MKKEFAAVGLDITLIIAAAQSQREMRYDYVTGRNLTSELGLVLNVSLMRCEVY